MSRETYFPSSLWYQCVGLNISARRCVRRFIKDLKSQRKNNTTDYRRKYDLAKLHSFQFPYDTVRMRGTVKVGRTKIAVNIRNRQDYLSLGGFGSFDMLLHHNIEFGIPMNHR